MERVILPDCCEDWILACGAFYDEGARFECIECAGAWQKLEPGRYRQVRSGRVWVERGRHAEGREFRYLEAEEGEGAITDRCCAKLILEYGDRIQPGREFACPLCGATWKKDLMAHPSGLQVAGYSNTARGVTIAVQKGEHRSFLVPMSEYRPPRFD